MKNKNMPEPVARRAVLRLPVVTSVASTELQNNFGKYMDVVEAGGMVTVTKNGKRIMRLVPVREAAEGASQGAAREMKQGAVQETNRGVAQNAEQAATQGAGQSAAPTGQAKNPQYTPILQAIRDLGITIPMPPEAVKASKAANRMDTSGGREPANARKPAGPREAASIRDTAESREEYLWRKYSSFNNSESNDEE